MATLKAFEKLSVKERMNRQIMNEFKDKMIELAEKEYNLDIKKNS